jgi:LacI family transcriptional regulator
LWLSKAEAEAAGHRYEACYHYRRSQAEERAEYFAVPQVVAVSRKDEFLLWVRRERLDLVLTGDVRVPGWLRSGGWRIPDEIGVAYLDAVSGRLPFGGVDQRPGEGGRAAVDLLVAECAANRRGSPAVPRTVLVPPVFVEGVTLRAG